jgi:hypothetical protein
MFSNFPILKGFFLFVFLLMSSLSFSQTYCASSGTTAYDTGITNVTFNTINNSDVSKNNGYEDFTSTSTTVVRGNAYDLSVSVNSGLYSFWIFSFHTDDTVTIAWIDWNQDGDFLDTGEQYNLGSIDRTNNSLTPNSPLSITIPSTATLGSTRMRITTRYQNAPTSCLTGFDGEVEDYTINVIASNTIITGTISPTSYCAGASVSIPYTITGTYTAGNVFTAQLSNATGSFASATNIGTRTATNAGTITATIPVGTAAGTGYRIRVISSTPSVQGADNGLNLTVNSVIANNTVSAVQSICSGSTPNALTGTTPTGGSGTYSYLWESSTASAATGFTNASGTNNAQNYTPGSLTQTTWYRRTVTSGSCSSTSTAIQITVNTVPTAPTTTGGQICIGSTATLSASGAGAGSVYKWYSAAAAGTLLKTSTNNTDNTYVTPTIAITTNYWVAILNASGCESARTIVAATFPTLSTDSQTTAGTNTWIGHVYDGTNSGVAYTGNFTNYYGSVTKAETFDETFGGNTTCYTVNSTAPLESRSIYTETFSVRYRMNSTKKGLYIVDLGSDDGSRLQVDGTLVYNNWVDQSFSTRSRVLMSLTGSSNLVYDFYENGGGNRVIFNNLVRVIENNLNTNTVQNICALSTGAAISGDTFGSLPSGISLSGTGYQWAYSTAITGPWTNISGATSATYTPTGSVAPFNTGGTFYFIRKAILSSANNVNPNLYIATNNSNVATVNFSNSTTWTGVTDKDWNENSNWSCGTVPTMSTDVIIPSSLASGNYPIIYSGDPYGKANNIEIQNNSATTLEIRDNYIQIAGNLLLNGVMDLVGEGQLLQTATSTVDNASTGYIERDQQGQGNKYRYNDWSSPVIKTGTTNGTAFKAPDVLRDGTDPSNPITIDFVGGYDGALGTPIKIAHYWMYKYANSPSGDYNAWQQIRNTGTIKPGEGFLMKGTGAPGSPDQNYVFVGKPNNGTIKLTVANGNDYLIGNPYPSAIDLNKFIDDNGSSIRPVIYFWEHYGGNSHNLRDYQAGYGTYTKGGAAPAASGATGTSNTGTAAKTPGRYLPIGQSFFVVGENSGTGTIEFNNGQRVFKKEALGSSIFMKGVAQKTTKESKENVSDTRPKFRLGFSGTKIDHRQILFTVDENSTDGVDWGYEAEIYELFEDDMFWTIDDKKYVIQASNSVDINKDIPLGITSSGGLIAINIDGLENVDESTDLFIKDSLTGLLHAIKNQSFEIDLPKGTYLNRFSFVFKTPIALEPEEPAEEILSDGIQVFMDNSIKELQIRKLGTEEIETVVLYNSLGQMSGYWKKVFSGDSFSLPVKAASGIYFVQIDTKSGKISKKVLVE